jgi:hypothetical protein
MDCPDITTLEQAEAKLPSSVLPISGLRRGSDGVLTDDAKDTILDGLKSRSIDITEPSTKQKIIADLLKLLCSANKQYQFLLKELYRRVSASAQISDEFTETIREKNLFMLDILTISRHIQGAKAYDGTVPFIEGWQNNQQPFVYTPDMNALTQTLQKDRAMLDSHSYEELRKHMVEITMEKNKVATNNLGFYGFLNLIAIGMIIYVAATIKS